MIDIKILGIEELQRNVKRNYDARKFRALDEVGQYFISEVQQRFMRSEDHEGHAWERLKYRSGKPLINTGILRASFTHRVHENSVEVGTNVIYAATHNYGRDKIPQREFMGISEINEKEINDILENKLGGLNG